MHCTILFFFFIIPGLKYALFEKLLLSNSYLLGVGGGAVVVLMWGYTGSLFITLVTVSTVVGAISLAYIMYTFIFEINFFPYVNILTTIIAIGELLLEKSVPTWMLFSYCPGMVISMNVC